MALGIAAITWRRRDTSGALTYVVLMLVLATWSTLYVLQVLDGTKAGKRLFFLLRHGMNPVIGLLFWTFAARYTDRQQLLDRRILAPLLVAGAGVFAIVFLNPGGLFYSAMELRTWDGLTLLSPSFGPLFWVTAVYVLGTVAIGHYFIVKMFMDTFAAYRPQLIAMTIVGIIEFTLAGLFLSQHTTFVPSMNPWPDVQLLTYGATIAAVPLGYSYFNDALFDIQPLARQTVIESMNDAVFVVDNDGVVRTTNATANRLVGLEAAASPNAIDIETLLEDRPELLERYRQEQVSAEEPEPDSTKVSYVIDGERRHFDVNVSPIYDSTGGQSGVVVVGRDVTQLRRQSETLRDRTAELEQTTDQLRAQNERLNLFGEYVSHDLRNPIQVASGNLELARQTGDLSHLDDIERAVERMNEMVSNLRELTSIDDSAMEPEPLQLSAVAESAWSNVTTGSAALSVEDDATLVADQDYLLHILENLFRNSYEHGQPEDARLLVTVGSLPDGFYLEDNGSGIPESVRDEVMTHGYSTTTSGTGLGLSIVNIIAEAHGWAVEVTNSPTGGARFEFSGVEAD